MQQTQELPLHPSNMVGLFVEGWYPSEEKAIMNTPLFTMAASLLTMAFPVLMMISGKYVIFVPWLICISAILLGIALLSTFVQRRVLVMHRGVHLSVVFLVFSILFSFIDGVSSWFALLFCIGLFVTTFRVANKTSAGYGVQFRREWNPKKLLTLNSNRMSHWKILNSRPTSGLMAVSRTGRQLAVMYCEFTEEECWLHLDVFSSDIFDLDGFVIEEV